MSNYEVNYDRGSGILTCRVSGFLSDGESTHLAQDLLAAHQAARKEQRVMRTLFDNHKGHVFSGAAVEALNSVLKGAREPEDRVAVLVANQINLLQAKRNLSPGDEVFVSEEDARAWLVT